MIITLMLSAILNCAVAADTLVQKSSNPQGDRGVMLNAEASNKPRDINIGMNLGDMGTLVLEDGMIMNYQDFPVYQYHHWAGGNAYSSQSLKPLEEAVIFAGKIYPMIDSWSKLGGDSPSGAITAGTSSFGRLKVDAQVGGPIAGGFSFTVSAYVNKDPGSTRPQQRSFMNDMQVYKTGITKRWNGGEFSALYKLSINNDVSSKSKFAPFYYVGDGSVRSYNGFRMGRDNYYPVDDRLRMMDAYDGSYFDTHLFGNINKRSINDAALLLKIDDVAGWKLDAGLHPCWSGNFRWMNITSSGISQITGGQNSSGQAVTLADGSAFEGNMQTSQAKFGKDRFLDVIGRITLSRKIGNHDITFGIDELYDRQFYYSSSAQFAQTVEKNPERILIDGEYSWKMNNGANFVDGWSTLTSFYGMDKWSISRHFALQYGLRGGLQWYGVDSATNRKGEHQNDRHPGFYIQDGTCKLNYDEDRSVNFSTLVKADWFITERLGFCAEHMFNRINRLMVVYFNAERPSSKPTDIQLARSWLKWTGDNLDLSGAVSYITRAHNKSSVNASKLVNGVPETAMYLADYSYATLGFTGEGTLHLGGFSFRAMLTYQDPKYRDYDCRVTFSDGSTARLNYNGKYTTGISRVLAELDPSYNFKKLRIWASVRYFSRQYANRVNNVYFNGHWESFAGVRWSITKNLNASVDAVNLLNAKGAKGKIDAADTITDNNLLKDYLIAGTFIIPFTMNFSLGYRF